MALWVCGGEDGCGTRYAVGLFRCPRCHNTEFYEDGDPMAKITRHGGASDKTLPTAEAEAVDAPAAEPLDVTEHQAGPAEPEPVPEPEEEGGEEPSPGNSSSASSETPQPNSEPSSKPTPKRARKTASRSAKAPTEGSSAPSTDGDPVADTSAADDE